ncbi:metal-dependent hydrolase [Azotosporobacter soli]|uniref:metal-dependent hydrolase n=1 Tax=Azotosporobacter soli TaxID=3055040 RepID=UPI0031FE688F
MQLQFWGHSCFLLSTPNYSLLFDPFLRDNPHQLIQPESIKCDYIFVSHGHHDHLGDAIEIAKANDAQIVATFELASMCETSGCRIHPMHIGGKHVFDFGSVRLTPALHGAGVSGGLASGFIVSIFGKTIYFAGDTGIFGDMQLLGRLESIDYALLPIGDNFTMGPTDAAEAAKMLNAKHVIPMHYNTWPLIAQNAETFKQDVEARFSIPVHILLPGQTLSLD